MNKNERHLFPGSNTSEGFFSLFQYILPVNNAKRVFYIKGGPGTGKSSFMKKVGEIFKDKGYNIEYFHCSSDNDSLDAIVIKELNIELLDGTAPHLNDPKYPGAIGEILDFGISLDKHNLFSEKDNIMEINENISDAFKRTYNYLSGAKSIHSNWSYYNRNSLNLVKLNSLKNDLHDKIFNNVKFNTEFKDPRHLFATAFTPNGIISYIKNLISDLDKIYVLKGDPGTGKTELLNFLKEQCCRYGIYVEVFHDPLIPSRVEHLIIPDLNTAVITSNELNKSFKFDKFDLIDMNELVNLSNYYKIHLKEDISNFYNLLNIALNNLTECKKLHDKLEEYYINNIDFNVVNKLSDAVIQRLLSYER